MDTNSVQSLHTQFSVVYSDPYTAGTHSANRLAVMLCETVGTRIAAQTALTLASPVLATVIISRLRPVVGQAFVWLWPEILGSTMTVMHHNTLNNHNTEHMLKRVIKMLLVSLVSLVPTDMLLCATFS